VKIHVALIPGRIARATTPSSASSMFSDSLSRATAQLTPVRLDAMYRDLESAAGPITARAIVRMLLVSPVTVVHVFWR
jgi:hypothetical protein